MTDWQSTPCHQRGAIKTPGNSHLGLIDQFTKGENFTNMNHSVGGIKCIPQPVSLTTTRWTMVSSNGSGNRCKSVCACNASVTLFNTLSATSTGKLAGKVRLTLTFFLAILFSTLPTIHIRGPTPFQGVIFYLLTDLDEICTAYVNLNSNSIFPELFFKFRYDFRENLEFSIFFSSNFQKNRSQKLSMLEKNQASFEICIEFRTKWHKAVFNFRLIYLF